jgi:DNA-binding transcriptional MocR family regulator
MPFAAHEPSAITVGSVSKSIWGGLRIGWIRANPALLQRVSRARPAVDLGTPVVEQLATAELLEAEAQRRPAALATLRAQRDAAVHALREHLPDVSAPVPSGGLTLWATLPSAVATRLAMIAPDHGVAIGAGPRFGVGGAFARNIRIPYSLPASELTEAIRRLAAAKAAIGRGARGRHKPAPLA